MFIARRCSAVGSLWYDLAASANEWAMASSASPRMMRACFSRAACASRDMASWSAPGMTTPRTPTDAPGPPPAARPLVVLPPERRLLGVVHHPEQHRVDVDRHGVRGQRLLRREAGGDRALVDPGRHAIDEWDDPEQAGAAQADEAAEAQDHGPLPLLRERGRVHERP